MRSKRFKKLPEKTSDLPSEMIEKLLPVVKKNCTTKFDESVDLNFQINNKQKKGEINISYKKKLYYKIWWVSWFKFPNK